MDDLLKKALGERAVLRKLPRLLRDMLLVVCLLSLSLLKAQADPQKQKISVDMSDATVEEVLQSIEEKSDYYFLYNSRLINVERRVNVQAKNKPVAAILDDLFTSGDVDYQVKGTQIVLSPMSMRASARSGAKEIQQQKTVSGRIVDEQGEPVIGANVVEKETTNGTVTDADGRFSLSVAPNGVLHVSYIGYLDEEVQVSGRTSVNITLREDTQALDEVVVVAYGTVKKKDLTGSITSIDRTLVAKQSNSSVSRALEGAAPGIQVASIDGQPGLDMGIRIRGVGSTSQNNSSALVVIDGVPSQTDNTLSSINPKDIENITILKDAASTALYGSRGANGVVLVTTKKGAKGKARISFEGRFGVNQMGPFEYQKISKPKDIYEYAWSAIYNAVRYKSDQKYTTHVANPNMSHDEAALFASRHLFDYVGSTTDFKKNALGNYMLYNVPGAVYTPTGEGADASSTMSGAYLVNPDGRLNPNAELLYEDNYDNFFFENKLRQEYNISASGGGDKVDYFYSLGYLEDPSYIRGSEFERYNARANMNARLLDWLKVGANVAYANRRTQSPATRYGRNPGSAVANVFRWANGQNQLTPLFAHDKNGDFIYNEDGSKKVNDGPDKTYSPLGPTNGPLTNANLIDILNKDKDETVSNDLNMRGYAELKFLKDFTLTLNLSYDRFSHIRTRYWNKETGQAKSTSGALGKIYQNFAVLNTQQLLNYNKTLDKHQIDFLAGHEFNKFNSDGLYYRSAYSLIPDFISYTNFTGRYVGGTFLNPGGSLDKTAMESYFGRLNYSYNDKYYAELSLRTDGSSKFKYSKNRWGTFWSVGGGWRMTGERFMESTKDWLNNLKIRASYGVIGNQSGIANYSGYQTWSYGANYTSTTGGTGTPADYRLSKGNFVNDALTWENVHTLDAGADLSLWNRVHLSVDYFVKNTVNAFWNQPIPYSLGQSSLEKNTAKLKNRGVEVDVSVDILKKKELYWSISLNGMHYRTILTSVPQGVGTAELNGNWTAGIDGWGAIGGAATNQISYLRGVGKDYYNLYFFKYGGVDQNTGLPLFYARVTEQDHKKGFFKDYKVGEDVTTTNYSLADRYEMGSAIPKWIGGFSTTLNYKNFDFSSSLAYQIGGKFFSVEYGWNLYSSENIGSALSAELLGNTWTPERTDAYFPMVMYGNTYGNGANIGSWMYSDMALFDASYLNVKNITFGYTLPEHLSKKVNISGLRIFATADNVFMFKKHAGFDPRMSLVSGMEVGAYAFPYMRTLSLGIDLNF